MKRVVIVLGILILIGVNIYISKLNKKIIDDMNNYLDDTSYEDKTHLLENREEEIIMSINNENIKSFNDMDNIMKDKEKTINDLVKENEELKNRNDNLTEQNRTLKEEYNKLYQEELEKSKYMINNVPVINQYSMGYPTGCESAALTVLLNYNGVNVSMSTVVELLKKGDKPHYENDILYGGNPEIEFVGHPSDSGSYGVYDKPIIDVANQILPGIKNGRGLSLDSVLNIVKEGRPVLVWNSMNLAVPYISGSWIYKSTGERINWLANEHALVVIGYNMSQVITVDSLSGTIKYFDRGTFENRYNAYGKRALYY